MKKLIPILLFAAFAYAGDAFNKGYNDGFDSGYCYEQSTLTCSSITAVRPDHFPRINEDSYVGGYMRGYMDGLKAQGYWDQFKQ